MREHLAWLVEVGRLHGVVQVRGLHRVVVRFIIETAKCLTGLLPLLLYLECSPPVRVVCMLFVCPLSLWNCVTVSEGTTDVTLETGDTN